MGLGFQTAPTSLGWGTPSHPALGIIQQPRLCSSCPSFSPQHTVTALSIAEWPAAESPRPGFRGNPPHVLPTTDHVVHPACSVLTLPTAGPWPELSLTSRPQGGAVRARASLPGGLGDDVKASLRVHADFRCHSSICQNLVPTQHGETLVCLDKWSLSSHPTSIHWALTAYSTPHEILRWE